MLVHSQQRPEAGLLRGYGVSVIVLKKQDVRETGRIYMHAPVPPPPHFKCVMCKQGCNFEEEDGGTTQ